MARRFLQVLFGGRDTQILTPTLWALSHGESPIAEKDSLAQAPGTNYEVVLTNTPFGKKSSITVVNEEGDEATDSLT